MLSLSRCMFAEAHWPFWKHEVSRSHYRWPLPWKHTWKNSAQLFISWAAKVRNLLIFIKRMKRNYGNKCVSLRQAQEWHKKFKMWSVKSGQPHTVNRSDANAKAERMIRGKPRSNNRCGDWRTEEQPLLGAPRHSRSAAVREVCVSRQLIPDLKERCQGVCETLFFMRFWNWMR